MALPVPGSDPPSAPPTAPTTLPPPPPVPVRQAIFAATMVLLLVGLVLSGLYVANVAPFAKSARSPAPPANGTFWSAEAVDVASAEQFGAGPWSVWFGTGLDPQRPVTINASEISAPLGSEPGCSVTRLVANDTEFVLPAFAGNLSSGEAPAWIFLAFGEGGAGLFSLVVNGSATPLVSTEGPACGAGYLQVIPGGAVNSPAAVQAALDDGGYAFMRSHPGGNLSFTAQGGELLLGFGAEGSWTVTYSTCPAASVTGTVAGFEFVAEEGLLNGTVEGIPSEGPVASCGSSGLPGNGSTSIPLGSALALSSITTSDDEGGIWYANLTVLSAASNLSWGDLEVELGTGNGSSLTVGEPVVGEASSGCGVAQGSLGDPNWGAPTGLTCPMGPWGEHAPVKAGDVISVAASAPLGSHDLSLWVTGQDSYTGSLSVPIL